MQCLLLAFVNINEFNIKERYRNVCLGKKEVLYKYLNIKLKKNNNKQLGFLYCVKRIGVFKMRCITPHTHTHILIFKSIILIKHRKTHTHKQTK